MEILVYCSRSTSKVYFRGFFGFFKIRDSLNNIKNEFIYLSQAKDTYGEQSK